MLFVQNDDETDKIRSLVSHGVLQPLLITV